MTTFIKYCNDKYNVFKKPSNGQVGLPADFSCYLRHK